MGRTAVNRSFSGRSAKMDETLLEAAADLGCPRWKAFWLVTVPLSLPGVTVRLGVKPEINAVCTIMIALVAIGTIAASLMAKRGAMRRERAALGAQV